MTSSSPEKPGRSKSPSSSSSSPSDSARAQDQPQPQPQPQGQEQAPQGQQVGDAIKCPSPDKLSSPLSSLGPEDNVQGARKRGRDDEGAPISDRDRKGKGKLEDVDPNIAHSSQTAKPLTEEETKLLQQKLAPTLLDIAKDIIFQFNLDVKPPPPKRAMMIDLNLPLSSEDDDDDYDDSDDSDDEDDDEDEVEYDEDDN